MDPPLKDVTKRSGGILLVCGAISAMSCTPGAPTVDPPARPAIPKGPSVWFGDLAAAKPISAEHGRAMAQYAGRAILQGKVDPGGLPGPVRADAAPRIVLLSAGGPGGRASVAVGAGRGIVRAVDAALAAMRRGPPGRRPAWTRLDIVTAARPAAGSWRATLSTFGRGLTGLAMAKGSGVALLPDEVLAAGLLNTRTGYLGLVAKYLRGDPLRAPAPQKPLRWPTGRGWAFSAAGWFCDGKIALPLFRGHRTFPEPSADDALQAAVLGGRYLARGVGSDGRFVYTYRPRTDDAPAVYNILRHAGTVFAMMELYEVTKDAKLLAAAERAIRYLLRSVRPCPTDRRAAWVVEKGAVKLGGNALAILALAKHAEAAGKRTHLTVMRKLARWIVSVQQPNGRFAVHKLVVSSGKASAFRSEYYPGEAIFALLRLHRIDPQDTWLDAAERNARYLITVRDRGLPDAKLPTDHWLLYALNELHRLRPKALYLDHARRISLAVCGRQIRKHERQDLVGGYDPRAPRCTPAATRTEGLAAAWMLLRDFGRPADARTVKQAVRLGIRFQLQMQYRPESAMFFPDPARCIGGFRHSYGSPPIRIDAVQHNISALLAWRRILTGRSGDTGLAGMQGIQGILRRRKGKKGTGDSLAS